MLKGFWGKTWQYDRRWWHSVPIGKYLPTYYNIRNHTDSQTMPSYPIFQKLIRFFFLPWPSSSIQYSICANLRWDLELYVETLVAKVSPTRTRIKYLSMSFRWRIVANEGMREPNKSLTLVAHANRNYRATTGLHGCQPCLCTGNNAKKKTKMISLNLLTYNTNDCKGVANQWTWPPGHKFEVEVIIHECNHHFL